MPSLLERQQMKVHDPAAHTFWHWVRFDLLARVAIDHAATEILDIGAGSGMLGDWIQAEHPSIRYRFEELSPLLDQALVERFGAEARHPGDGNIPSTTVVALLDVLEHIEHDRQALTTLFQRMQPGGVLVVTVPALQWAFSSWDTELGHFRRYSRGQLRTVLGDAGFDVLSSNYLFPELLVMLPLRKLRRAKRTDVDFPQLSPWVNRVGYWISSTTARLRRFWPLGTSVIAVATRQQSNG